MNRIASTLFIALFSYSAYAIPAPAHEWEEIHHDDLVTVYRKEVEGSDVLALKGTGTLDAPIGKILGVVLDVKRRPEWMEQVKSVEVIREISPNERIEYMHLSPPWPVKDRDIVVDEKVEVDRAAHKITVRMKSVEDPSHPVRPDRVRAMLYSATFEVTPADGGQKTAMVAESHSDPKGSIPKWVVNFFSKNMPSKTLTKLLARVREPGVTDYPLASEVLTH